jgi:hypothetical protein
MYLVMLIKHYALPSSCDVWNKMSESSFCSLKLLITLV